MSVGSPEVLEFRAIGRGGPVREGTGVGGGALGPLPLPPDLG